MFVLTRNWSRHAMRSSMAFYLLMIDLVAVGGYVVAGLLTSERLILIAVAIVPVPIGLRVGAALLRHMNERVFRHAVVAVIIASSLAVLGREALRL